MIGIVYRKMDNTWETNFILKHLANYILIVLANKKAPGAMKRWMRGGSY